MEQQESAIFFRTGMLHQKTKIDFLVVVLYLRYKFFW